MTSRRITHTPVKNELRSLQYMKRVIVVSSFEVSVSDEKTCLAPSVFRKHVSLGCALILEFLGIIICGEAVLRGSIPQLIL